MRMETERKLNIVVFTACRAFHQILAQRPASLPLLRSLLLDGTSSVRRLPYL